MHQSYGRFSPTTKDGSPLGVISEGLLSPPVAEALRGSMNPSVNKISGDGPQKKRKGVAQILRASYALFAQDEETVMAVRMVLGSGGNEYRTHRATRITAAGEFQI